MSSTAQTMPPSQHRPLSLIVATTHRTLGIGKAGALPWPQLKGEMRHFARTTTGPIIKAGQKKPSVINAVIMGRKTWLGIPPRFRPLKKRINVVVTTQDAGSVDLGLQDNDTGAKERRQDGHGEQDHEDVIIASSLDDALERLKDQHGRHLGHVFVIGGTQLYTAALAHPATQWMMMSVIEKEYDCDTFFPLDVEKEDRKKDDDGEGRQRQHGTGGQREERYLGTWIRRGEEELRELFVGQEGQIRGIDDGVAWEVRLYERGDGQS